MARYDLVAVYKSILFFFALFIFDKLFQIIPSLRKGLTSLGQHCIWPSLNNWLQFAHINFWLLILSLLLKVYAVTIQMRQIVLIESALSLWGLYFNIGFKSRLFNFYLRLRHHIRIAICAFFYLGLFTEQCNFIFFLCKLLLANDRGLKKRWFVVYRNV